MAPVRNSCLCIDQPNALLFENFDRLLLLQKGGECVYFGAVGKDSNVLSSYLERNVSPNCGEVDPEYAVVGD